MIGIVILNYNNWKETEKCIYSLEKELGDKDRKIYLVDNDSVKPMPESMKELIHRLQITFVTAKKNRGYAAGNNIGIKIALDDGCEAVLITNNDIEFCSGSIDSLYNYLCKNQDVGIVGPKVYLQNGSVQEINYGCKLGLKQKYMYILRKTIFKPLVRSFLYKFHANSEDLKSPIRVYAVSGCCFMMSRKCALEITPLDEGTFLYEEENIIGVRMEKAGLKTVYNTDAAVVHGHGKSIEKTSTFSYKCLVQSEIYYCRKYLQEPNCKIIPLYLIRTAVFIRKFRFKGLFSYIKTTIVYFK